MSVIIVIFYDSTESTEKITLSLNIKLGFSSPPFVLLFVLLSGEKIRVMSSEVVGFCGYNNFKRIAAFIRTMKDVVMTRLYWSLAIECR